MTEAQQKILDAVSRFSRAAMAQNDPAHDSAHVERVVRLTQNLSARSGADA